MIGARFVMSGMQCKFCLVRHLLVVLKTLQLEHYLSKVVDIELEFPTLLQIDLLGESGYQVCSLICDTLW